MTNYVHTKETLDHLYRNLQSQLKSANADINKKNFKSASKTLSLAKGKAEQELLHAEKELALPSSSSLEQENEARFEVEQLYKNINTLLVEITDQKIICDQNYTTKEFLEELDEEQKRIQKIKEKQITALHYERSFSLLSALQEQKRPLVGVEEELHRDGGVSVEALAEAMDAAYVRLTGGSREEFDKFTNRMQAQHSIPLKVLGTALILLGAALIASAILFAPAVITAAGTGLAKVYLATAGTTMAASALSIGGTSCFFAKTHRMQLAEIGHDLGKKNLEDHHYQASYPAV